jgi:hypothetical protein
VGGERGGRLSWQIFAGSAMASQAVLDQLNMALRAAAMEGGVIGSEGFEGFWGGRMKVCRPDEEDDV